MNRYAGFKILIVDDELNICRSCTKVLTKLNYDVEYTLNGYDALKMMDTEPFDIVITDLKMSSLGGMEVLRRVKDAYLSFPLRQRARDQRFARGHSGAVGQIAGVEIVGAVDHQVQATVQVLELEVPVARGVHGQGAAEAGAEEQKT